MESSASRTASLVVGVAAAGYATYFTSRIAVAGISTLVKDWRQRGASGGERRDVPFQEAPTGAPEETVGRRLTHAEVARTLIENGRYGVLSTLSVQVPGYPQGSVVGFAADPAGTPFFAFSDLSNHTQNLAKDKRCSLTVTDVRFKGAADSRVTLIGDVVRVPKTSELRELYLLKHPDAFWVDFKDFHWYRLGPIRDVALVGGFARAASVHPSTYHSATPDPIAPFIQPITKHMNDDHSEELKGYAKKYLGVSAEAVTMTSIDRFGFDIAVFQNGETSTERIPFPVVANTRQSVKEQLVAMADALATSSDSSSFTAKADLPQ